MYLTEKEMLSQHIALRQTYAFLQGYAERIKDFYGLSGFFSVTFTGCGASYAICRSAAFSLRVRGGLTTMSFPAGDLMLNMPFYQDMLNGTLLFAVSRSGSTSEVIRAVEQARRQSGAQIIAITAVSDSKLAQISDLALPMPWCFDEGHTATRSLTNMYAANLYNIGLLSGDPSLLEEIRKATDEQESFIDTYHGELEGIGQSGVWDNALVLSDGELGGVGLAGAITIERLTGLPARHAHILDARHNQLASLTPKSLVLAAVSPVEEAYQSVLFRQIREVGAQLITLSSKHDNIFNADLNIVLPNYKHFAVRGIPILFALQAVGYHRAVTDDRNPDGVPGQARWVSL